MKRRHELEPGAAAREGSDSALYASAENEAHRKPGAGNGQASKRKRAIDLSDPKRVKQQRDYAYSQQMDAQADVSINNERAARKRGDREGMRDARRERNQRLEQSMWPGRYRLSKAGEGPMPYEGRGRQY